MQKKGIFFILICGLLVSCDLPVLNTPYPKKAIDKNILFSSFSERPKTLDPAKAYSSSEYQFINQIYEPLLQYDYFKRPYTLVPLTAKALPDTKYLDINGQMVKENSNDVAFTKYIFTIKPDISYQPHPSLAKKDNKLDYYPLAKDYLKKYHIKKLNQFKDKGTRLLTVDDYIYQIKRLADKKNHSPIRGVMAKSIVGFNDFSKELEQERRAKKQLLLDYPLSISGVKKESENRFSVMIHGKNPEFIYWFAMPFFAPMPVETVLFYNQPGFTDLNINLDWQPIGTGPFYLAINNPNRKMLLKKNPNYRKEIFPIPKTEVEKKLFKHQLGKSLPLLDEVNFALEKESIPRWNKFLQGYFDTSGVSSDSFDQAFRVNTKGEIVLTPEMAKKDITLYSATEPTIFYLGFNMLDKTVGGYQKKQKKLRQAISIAVDFEEYISIFMNGRGIAANSPIPPGIDGYKKGKAGMNPYVYQWQGNIAKRKGLAYAKALMIEAGYPNGIDLKTKKPLILNYDVPATSSPDDKARLNWYRKQFKKLGISLNIRATQYNRFSEKMRTGNAQIFSWGWHADYPSSENFLFLLYGPNGKVKGGGENAANYNNKAFNVYYQQYKKLLPGPEREALVEKMIHLAQADAPWVWGVFPKSFLLTQSWQGPLKISTIGSNTLKYQSIDSAKRQALQIKWNQPVIWPAFLLLSVLFLFLLPIVISYWKKEHHPIKRI